MAENTKIEWTDHTFNPWEGCQKVGPGCDNCYAETRNARFAGGQAVNWGPGAPRRRTTTSNWNKPLKWNKQAELASRAWEDFKARHLLSDQELEAKGFIKPRRPRVFCASLADVFDNAVDPQWRADLFGLIMKTPRLDWLLLTKRIGNVKTMLSELAHESDPDLSLLDMMPLPNVWIGTTICNQREANRDIDKLLAIPAHRHFLSMEPLLSSVNLVPWIGTDDCSPPLWLETPRAKGAEIDWVIVGGESGPGARPMHPDWARNIRDQCTEAGTAFLFKQWGEWSPAKREGNTLEIKGVAPFTDKPEWHTFADGQEMARIGKKAAGRLLDCRTWDEFPPS